jgi:hypothetical protein
MLKNIPLVYFALVFPFFGAFASCENTAQTPQKNWQFSYVASDSLAPNTAIQFCFKQKNYDLGGFLGKFDTFPSYLKRVDLPDSTIAVCRGKWTGGNRWLAAVRQNNKISFFQAHEDSENYNEDYEEVLRFREMPLNNTEN